ncbi:hypothetical protein [Coraliomargarita parva]|uniref:hypothetical protein n=1 Tax=Coraliomargarita parva TaxID=3014050 RepID=UPI0022B421B7|nr:hypothetical protein [Coraliomargarita parva]
MRTTIDISDATLEELRRRAGESQRPLRQVVEETLQRGLASNPTVRKTVPVKSYPVGIKAAYRGVSLNQLYDQIESEDHLKLAEE